MNSPQLVVDCRLLNLHQIPNSCDVVCGRDVHKQVIFLLEKSTSKIFFTRSKGAKTVIFTDDYLLNKI